MNESFEERYKTGDLPWDHGTFDSNLSDIVTKHPIPKCKALDIGCGTGSNVIWLAKHGFKVTGCDISPTAIEIAKEKTSDANVESTLVAADFLKEDIPGAPFGFVFDRGCLHTMDTPEDRIIFAQNVASLLDANGLWLSLIGNADDKPRDVGPPRLTAAEITNAVEANFEIISLKADFFKAGQEDPPKAWICLMKIRNS
ncbi:methyltransferase type 11 [bacterium B17]|nr:methyltransferase type 11 [bacterium B17]